MSRFSDFIKLVSYKNKLSSEKLLNDSVILEYDKILDTLELLEKDDETEYEKIYIKLTESPFEFNKEKTVKKFDSFLKEAEELEFEKAFENNKVPYFMNSSSIVSVKKTSVGYIVEYSDLISFMQKKNKYPSNFTYTSKNAIYSALITSMAIEYIFIICENEIFTNKEKECPAKY